MSEGSDSDTDEFQTALTETFVSEYGADEDTAAGAAEKATAFREDVDEGLTVETVLDALAAAPYGEFEHAFDFAIGNIAEENEDCTDSRAYRLSGFGDLAADPTQGA